MKRILVPLDGSPPSAAALEFAADEWPDASVTLLHVIDPVKAGYSASALPSGSEEWYQKAKAEATAYFREARQTIDDTVAVETRTEVGRPAKTIVTVADDGYDLVVMGSHGREGVSRVVLGSVAEHVVRASPIPVLVVR